jgi:transketolase
MGVGLALAERAMADRFNRDGLALFDHQTWGLVSDGDLMEGVAAEAASLAGTQRLGKIVYVHDDNRITIEGRTDIAFTEDVRQRFEAYGWQVIVVSDGEDLGAVQLALENARAETERPSLVMARTVIGAGSPKSDSPSAHGEPLGPEALEATRAHYGYAGKPPFFVDDRVAKNFAARAAAHRGTRLKWLEDLEEYGRRFPDLRAELARRLAGETPPELGAALRGIGFDPAKPVATRAASGKAVNAAAAVMPELVGGSADLAPSNKTALDGLGSMGPQCPGGRNVHYGIREHAMGAVMNGLALHGGIVPFGGTFLVFSDFLRPAVRLSALMSLKVVYVLTHDSVGVGEDGPTHQPVEHLAALRAIPNLMVFRPADAFETSAGWLAALGRPGPSAMILSRQNLPVYPPSDYPAAADGPLRGGYVLSEAPGGPPEAVIIATGSEVALALAAQRLLASAPGARRVRVVSMPSWELFGEQGQDWRDEVLPPALTRRLAVEAGRRLGWERWVGDRGDVLSIDAFGRSAPAGRIFSELGFTAENVAARVEALF